MATSYSSSVGYSGYNSYTPVIPTGPTAPYGVATDTKEDESSSSSSKGTTIGGLDAEMVKWLYKEGLASDVAEFLDSSEWAINHAYDPITGKARLSAYKLILPKLALIKLEKELYNKALEELNSKDAIGEYAITLDGRMVVFSLDGSIKFKRPNELDNTDTILTNGDLLKTRSTDKAGAFKTYITDIIANGTSSLAVISYLNDAIKKIGSETREFSNSSPNYQDSLQLQLLLATQLLQKVVNGQVSIEEFAENQQEQVKMALNFIIGTMPLNMKTLLDVKGMQSGLNGVNLLMSWLGALSGSTVKSKLQLTGVSSASGKDTSDPMQTAVQWLNGLGEKRMITLQLGSIGALGVPTNTLPITKGDKPMGMVTLDLVGQSDFGGLLDLTNVTSGDHKIDYPNIQDVVVDAGSLFKMELPLDLEAASRGEYKPDLSWMDAIELAERLVHEQGVLNNPEEINKIYQSLNIPLKYSTTGNNPQLSAKYAIFGVLNAYATNKIFGEDTKIDRQYVKEITEDYTLENIKRIINKGYTNGNSMSFSKGIGGDHMYLSVVFIPIRNNYFNAISGSGWNPTIQDALLNKEPLQLQQDKMSRYVAGGKP